MSIARINRSCRKYGKQKSTCLKPRTKGSRPLISDCPNQLAKAQTAAKRGTILLT